MPRTQFQITSPLPPDEIAQQLRTISTPKWSMSKLLYGPVSAQSFRLSTTDTIPSIVSGNISQKENNTYISLAVIEPEQRGSNILIIRSLCYPFALATFLFAIVMAPTSKGTYILGIILILAIFIFESLHAATLPKADPGRYARLIAQTIQGNLEGHVSG